MRLVVTKDDYFAAALQMLAAEGHGALKIGALCQAIGVTTGSFYHYFGSWDGFVAELLTHWEQEKTQRLAAATVAEADSLERMKLIKTMAIALPHDAETAIRAWSHVNPIVAEVQQRVDGDRLAALRAVIAGMVGNRRRADQLAITGMTLLVGVQQWRSPVDTTELAQLLDDFELLILADTQVPAGAR